MLTRRSFLQSSSLLALSPDRAAVRGPVGAGGGPGQGRPRPRRRPARRRQRRPQHRRPVRRRDYAKLRPRLKLDPKDLVKLTDALGLHPALRPLDKLLRPGSSRSCPGVGYPNPNRSHFESMAIWHTARFDPEDRKGYGWLGRALDPTGRQPVRGRRRGPDGPPRPAEYGRRVQPASRTCCWPTPRGRTAGVGAGAGRRPARVRPPAGGGRPRRGRQAGEAGRRRGRRRATRRPALAERLKLVARLLKAGRRGAGLLHRSRAGTTRTPQQQFAHADLLGEFAGAVAAFFADLTAAKLADRVALLAFSEFGRTIKENGSAGHRPRHGRGGVPGRARR